MSVLWDFFLKEFAKEEKKTNCSQKDFINFRLKQGKKIAINTFVELSAMEFLTQIIKSFGSNRIELFLKYVDDEIAKEIIEVYQRNQYETIIPDDVDKIKTFKNVHSIHLLYFAFFYGQYHQLDIYAELLMNINPQTSKEDFYVSKADAMIIFSENCKKYSIDEQSKEKNKFVRECIDIINSKFDLEKSRIKFTNNYKNRLHNNDDDIQKVEKSSRTKATIKRFTLKKRGDFR